MKGRRMSAGPGAVVLLLVLLIDAGKYTASCIDHSNHDHRSSILNPPIIDFTHILENSWLLLPTISNMN